MSKAQPIQPSQPPADDTSAAKAYMVWSEKPLSLSEGRGFVLPDGEVPLLELPTSVKAKVGVGPEANLYISTYLTSFENPLAGAFAKHFGRSVLRTFQGKDAGLMSSHPGPLNPEMFYQVAMVLDDQGNQTLTADLDRIEASIAMAVWHIPKAWGKVKGVEIPDYALLPGKTVRPSESAASADIPTAPVTDVAPPPVIPLADAAPAAPIPVAPVVPPKPSPEPTPPMPPAPAAAQPIPTPASPPSLPEPVPAAAPAPDFGFVDLSAPPPNPPSTAEPPPPLPAPSTPDATDLLEESSDSAITAQDAMSLLDDHHELDSHESGVVAAAELQAAVDQPPTLPTAEPIPSPPPTAAAEPAASAPPPVAPVEEAKSPAPKPTREHSPAVARFLREHSGDEDQAEPEIAPVVAAPVAAAPPPAVPTDIGADLVSLEPSPDSPPTVPMPALSGADLTEADDHEETHATADATAQLEDGSDLEVVDAADLGMEEVHHVPEGEDRHTERRTRKPRPTETLTEMMQRVSRYLHTVANDLGGRIKMMEWGFVIRMEKLNAPPRAVSILLSRPDSEGDHWLRFQTVCCEYDPARHLDVLRFNAGCIYGGLFHRTIAAHPCLCMGASQMLSTADEEEVAKLVRHVLRVGERAAAKFAGAPGKSAAKPAPTED